MSMIRVLPPGLQNQIAAGEVVERPSAVVKELMENSLDAGATSIQVHLESGGQSLIKIIDNGQGMRPEDIPLALTRHATSKISALEELSRISSYGFRGEALPSIASISKMTISSCPGNNNEGYFYKLIFGEVADQGPLAMTRGTRIRVENLLSNVPARLKFLKTRATEGKKCVEAFIRHSLTNLYTDFELLSESRSLYRFYPGETLQQRIEAIWPNQVCEHLREFSLRRHDFAIHGLASSPESAQARADRIMFYINNRPVSDRMLLAALRQAYQGRLLSREYPQAVIFISVPLEEVDVNVHPAKTQVRFRNEKEIFSLIVAGIGSILNDNIYQSSSHVTRQFDNEDGGGNGGDSSELSAAFQGEGIHEDNMSETYQEQESLQRRFKEKKSSYDFVPHTSQVHETIVDQVENHQSKDRFVVGRLAYLGQIVNSYLLFKKQDHNLLIVDQHAAHERVMLEGYKKGFRKIVIKKLALPERLSLHPSELDMIQGIWKKIRTMGYILELQEDSTLLISGIPDFMNISEATEVLRDIMAEKKSDLDEIFITMACKSSIKAGSNMTSDEALGLMDQLLSCDNNQYCPHGRPITRELGSKELEKMFKR
ncbi:DNA mismatch repair endonuclease MutL [Desulfonatronovibrio magnus]|uniref:DNA mismatch repair endonuclease MutL n=1 Tax=Desulfonatronovibrio magnus TaxID=698827 RepID=UPI0005EB9160|nr:DNA mismatch repair endonuclease MutL [Desulfonatronovibrio magnus]